MTVEQLKLLVDVAEAVWNQMAEDEEAERPERLAPSPELLALSEAINEADEIVTAGKTGQYVVLCVPRVREPA